MSAATAAVKKKIVVCGGNGFLALEKQDLVGRLRSALTPANPRKPHLQGRLRPGLGCHFPEVGAALAQGREADAVRTDRVRSRSGEPKWASVTSSPKPPAWSSKVTWAKADVLAPGNYRSLLESADAVVHSMGILFEADYKGVLTGQVSPVQGLQRAFSSTKAGTQDPLSAASGAPLTPQEHDGQLTYEVMNRDSAVGLAREANDKGVASFVYISAAAGAPVLPQRYITTKREAESTIASEFPKMRPIFIRPGMLYDSSRSITMGLAGVTGLGALANSLTGGRLTPLMGAGGTKPLKADVVAEAAVESLDDESVRGVVDVAQIESLANTAWRKGML